jgi:hypothetical protein
VKIYHRHRCRAAHRSYRRFALCIFGRATQVMGEGPYALIARCGSVQVMLFGTLGAAIMSKEAIDRHSCGHACQREHEIAQLLRF